MSRGRRAISWIERTDWLWTIIGGFYLLAYLFWYVPALVEFPRSLQDPPAGFPWHWSLDFVATGVTGTLLVYVGFQRATQLSDGRDTPRGTGRDDPSIVGDGESGTGRRSSAAE